MSMAQGSIPKQVSVVCIPKSIFFDSVSKDEVREIPDYVLSDTLQADLESSVAVCIRELKKTKYIPADAAEGCRYGFMHEGQREGEYIDGWEDYEILGANGEPVYTKEIMSTAEDAGEFLLTVALGLIVRDICDSGDFLTQDWYQARIVQEYFQNYPITANSAYLIGELFKEMCAKGQFEGDLKSYYARLSINQAGRQKGTKKTSQKAEHLRDYCVELFVKLAKELGVRLLLAPDKHQARQLRTAALAERLEDFLHNGKPYSEEWFLRHIIEDRRLEIVQALEEPS